MSKRPKKAHHPARRLKRWTQPAPPSAAALALLVHITPQLRPLALPVASVTQHPANVREHGAEDLAALRASLQEHGQVKPIVVQASTGYVLAGNGTHACALELKWSHIAVVVVAMKDREAERYALRDNRTAELSKWGEGLAAALRRQHAADGFEGLQLLGWSEAESDAILNPPGLTAEAASQKLSERFIVPPFSVLDARQGYWQERKRAWLALGIQSELGRGANALGFSEQVNAAQAGRSPYKKKKQDAKLDRRHGIGTTGDPYRKAGEEVRGASATGTSIFDPVLCELAYRWFSPPSGRVLDPFAGGSVRGIVAGRLGRRYLGIDLSAEQLAANRAQAVQICGKKAPPIWKEGDAQNVRQLCDGAVDFVFSCPPYGDLEVYSSDPRDLSTMKFSAFLSAYRRIIAGCIERLAVDRFACFVVGDFRDDEGWYQNFVALTIEAFQEAGATLYNEAILVTSVGSLPLRVRRQFEAMRKLGKTHQNVLVFCKGDPKKAVSACGKVDVTWPEAPEDAAPLEIKA